MTSATEQLATFLDGDVAALVLRFGELDATTRGKLADYLRKKYGFSTVP